VDVIREKARMTRWACDKALKTLVDRGESERKGTGNRNDPYVYRLAVSFVLSPKGGNAKQKKPQEPEKPAEKPEKVSFGFESVTRGTEAKEKKGATVIDALRIFGGKVVKP